MQPSVADTERAQANLHAALQLQHIFVEAQDADGNTVLEEVEREVRAAECFA